MAHHDVVVVGASAGGFQALKRLAASLPAELPAAVLMALHLPQHLPSVLPTLFARVGKLPTAFGRHGERLRRGRIYLAPPDRHLLLDGGRLYLGAGPPENNARPAIDPLFRSAAMCCGPRAIGVVLTGMLSDGSSGLRAIRRCGGIAVVQDPADAEFPDMPRNALAIAKPDHVAPLAEIPGLIARLVARKAGRRRRVPDDVRLEVGIAARGSSELTLNDALGERSTFACPSCGGVLWEIGDGEEIRYRCHTGHAFTARGLDHALGHDLSRALASAVRALDERAGLMRRLADVSRTHRHGGAVKSWEAKARGYEQQARLVRRALRQIEGLAGAEADLEPAADD